MKLIIYNPILFCHDTSWKKFDSGKFTKKNPGQDFKKTASYISYKKGTKDIKVELYIQSKKNKKSKFSTVFISKTGNKITASTTDFEGKKSKQSSIQFKGNVKEFYNYVYIFNLKKNGL